MQTEEITIRVDPAVAKAYKSATDQDRLKMEFLMSLELQGFFNRNESVEDVMRDISRKAKERGMTLKILESILSER